MKKLRLKTPVEIEHGSNERIAKLLSEHDAAWRKRKSKFEGRAREILGNPNPGPQDLFDAGISFGLAENFGEAVSTLGRIRKEDHPEIFESAQQWIGDFTQQFLKSQMNPDNLDDDLELGWDEAPVLD